MCRPKELLHLSAVFLRSQLSLKVCHQSSLLKKLEFKQEKARDKYSDGLVYEFSFSAIISVWSW